MDKVITYDMLDGFGEAVKGFYKLLYPNGLTVGQLLASERRILRTIGERFAEEV